MTAPLDLDAIRARAEAASEGPWEAEALEGNIVTPTQGTIVEVYSWTDDDAEFIAASREDVPALLAEVERLRADRDRQGRFLSVVAEFARTTGMSHAEVMAAVGVKADADRLDAEQQEALDADAVAIDPETQDYAPAVLVVDLYAAIEGTDS